MTVELFGKKFSANHETKITSEIFDGDESIAILRTSTIKGRLTQTPIKTIKEFDVLPKDFVEKINSTFEEHNKEVDKYYDNLKLNTIDVIRGYCGEWSSEKRKQYVEETVQKRIYDIDINGSIIRLVPKQIFFFENKRKGDASMVYDETMQPVVFVISEEEFNELEKMFLNF